MATTNPSGPTGTFESDQKDVGIGNPLSVSEVDAEAPVGDAEPSLWLLKVGATVLRTPIGVWLGVGIALGLGVANLSYLGPGITPLRALSQVCRAGGDMLIVLPLFSLGRVTRERYWVAFRTSGVTMSAEAATRLQRWHLFLVICMVFMAFGYWGMFNILYVGLLGKEDPSYEDYQIQRGETSLTAQQRLHAILLGLYSSYVAPLVYCSWYLSLKEVSVLVRDDIAVCCARIDTTSTSSDEWHTIVLPGVLKLARQTLPSLSKGWADGLLAIWLGLWVTALGIFAKFLDGGNIFDLGQTVAGACFPLALAADVANASSACDKIGQALNTKRAVDMSYENHSTIEVTESLLRNLNKGQGLGFVVSGKVLDRSTLRSIFAAMAGFLGTACPLILALKQEKETTGSVSVDAQCGISAQTVAVIQSALVGRNATCLYNVSLGAVLDM